MASVYQSKNVACEGSSGVKNRPIFVYSSGIGMTNLKRIGKFLGRYVFRHPLYVLTYGLFYFRKEGVANVHLYTESEMKNLIQAGKSLVRFGDGEVNVLLSLNNHYQSYSPEMERMLKKIIRDYTPQSPYILAVPRFVNVSNEELKRIGKFNVWLPLKAMFRLWFPQNVAYMDAHNFYYDEYFDSIVGPLLADRHVILVTNEETIDKQKQNPRLPWKEFSGVATPKENSLAAYDTIKEEVKNEVERVRRATDKSIVLLFALGPVGKYLTYEFALSGVQSLDIGKVAEVMYTGESVEWMI